VFSLLREKQAGIMCYG